MFPRLAVLAARCVLPRFWSWELATLLLATPQRRRVHTLPSRPDAMGGRLTGSCGDGLLLWRRGMGALVAVGLLAVGCLPLLVVQPHVVVAGVGYFSFCRYLSLLKRL